MFSSPHLPASDLYYVFINGKKQGTFWPPVGRFVLALAGLLLSTGGVLFWEPLSTLSQKCLDKISICLPFYAYLFVLNPLNFYLSILLLLLHVTAHAGAPDGATPAFLKKHLPRATHTVSMATLVVSAPLYIHAAVAEESVGLATGAALLCLALVTILASVCKKLLVSRGFVPALFALCISVGFLTSVDPLLSFSNKNQYDPLVHHIPIHLLLSVTSFSILMLSIILVILRIRAPADNQQAENLVVGALSVAIASLLVGWYMKVYVELTGMAAFVVEAVEL